MISKRLGATHTSMYNCRFLCWCSFADSTWTDAEDSIDHSTSWRS